MPVSHFRPIRPRSTTNQEGLMVAEFKSSTIEVETKTERRSSIACRECQRRRTKVGNLRTDYSTLPFIIVNPHFSVPGEISAQNARGVIIFAYSMRVLTNDAKAI